jgi:peroxiredoxin family protein
MDTILQVGTTGLLETRLVELESEVRSLREQLDQQIEERVSIICFSGEWDRLFAALSIASGALAMGAETHLFFTFWGVSALRCNDREDRNGKSLLQSMFGRLLPCGAGRAPLSKYNFGGFGKMLMRRIMKHEGVEDIDALFEEVKELGAQIHLCDTTSGLFGLSCQELDAGDSLDQCGVATFLSLALKSKVVLFI